MARYIRPAVIVLPSGNVISGETWEDMKDAGDWRGFLDARMYPQADRDFMDAEINATNANA